MRYLAESKLEKHKKNKFIRRYRYHLMLSLGAICLVFIYILMSLSPVSAKSRGREVVVAIPVSATANQVGDILEQNELVRNGLVFSLYARYTGLDSRIKAGEYRLNDSYSTPELLRELVQGRLAEMSFTVPEGYTTAQIADLLAAKGLVDRQKFMLAVSEEEFPYSFVQGLPKGEKRLEGYLFPDTYQVDRGSTEVSIIDMMLKRFASVIEELDYQAQAESKGVTLHKALTVASMVEREAMVDEERPLIAGVIYNRLNIDMPLQVDATVQYALGTTKPTLFYEDLEIDSPYNTYKIYGLPPGPIAMPGRTSLLAAIQPDRTEYLYYVAKPDGSHAFATTLAEHNANRERYEE
ncbi:endolytic transglycosylase MltG [Pelotomaculum propionicicum]|uniref:endolytic transglycosylase MltG n=1 Tax=Pelotomaculum propionicicum TaxID=258475 RepID=UPI003B7FF005